MGESIFIFEGGRFVPTEHARGPWDAGALHGGAPAALITAAFERMEPGEELCIGRLGFEFLRPIPLAPLELTTRIERDGRRVQELGAELHAGGLLVARASAVRVQPVAPEAAAEAATRLDRPAPAAAADGPLPPPTDVESVPFTLEGSSGASFAGTAMEMRWLDDPLELGPRRVWMRLRHPLLPGQEPTPLSRLAASADFANGVSAELPFERFLFINADLAIHLRRPPGGEWIGLDARTLLSPGGSGLSECVLHDERGALGRAFQTLVVQAR